MTLRSIKPPETKSPKIIIDCIVRMLKLARHRRIAMVAIVFVGADHSVHLDRIGPRTIVEKDKLLEALEQLHEDVFTSE